MVALLAVFNLFTPLATIRKASISKPESVSSRIESFGSSIAIWKISLRFFSPPEKPSFTLRLASLLSNSTIARFSRISFRNSVAETGGRPLYFRCSLTAARMKFTILTPGISTGYWKLKNKPSRLRSSGDNSNRFFPLNVTSPSVTSKAGFPTKTLLSVLFPEPFGPMIAWTSPAFTERFIPFNISLPFTLACKFFISNIFCFPP